MVCEKRIKNNDVKLTDIVSNAQSDFGSALAKKTAAETSLSVFLQSTWLDAPQKVLIE